MTNAADDKFAPGTMTAYRVRVVNNYNGLEYVVNVTARTKEQAARRAITQCVRDHGYSAFTYSAFRVTETRI